MLFRSRADRWPELQSALADAATIVLAAQGRAGLPAPEPATQPFFDRPFVTVGSAIAPELRAPIRDTALLGLPPGLGSIEQWTDSTAVLAHPAVRCSTRATYRALLTR